MEQTQTMPQENLRQELAETKKILLVDDVELFIQLEKSFLTRKEGIEVLTAYDGMEALEIIQNEKPDLVYMDLYMPKMNGDDCCRLIKQSEELKDIPIVMVTHGGKEEDLERCMEAGCNEIITKPINRSLFHALAKKYIKVKTRVEPRYSARLKVRFGTGMDKILTDYSVNLSTGGLFLATASALPIDTELFVDFELPDRAQPISCRARVAWVNNQEELVKQELPTGMGLQFREITLDDLDAIRQYISREALTADW